MRISIIDDEYEIVTLATDELRELFPEFEIYSYTEPEGFLSEKLQEREIIVCDLNMPGINGIELYKRKVTEISGDFIFFSSDPKILNIAKELEEDFGRTIYVVGNKDFRKLLRVISEIVERKTLKGEVA